MNFKSIINVLISTVLISVAVICIINQEIISSAVYLSMSRCVKRIIPSLFAMSVLSGIIQRTGALEFLFSKYGLNAGSLCCFIFGNIGGYPIGAKTVTDMVNQSRISKDIAERVICYSFSCGPAFAISVSYAVYGNTICGFAAFISILISNLILYLLYSIRRDELNYNRVNHENFSTKLIVECVLNSTNAMLLITAMIAIFSVFSEVLKIYFPKIFVSVIPSIFEISNLITLNNLSLPCFTSLLALGGLCVLIQVSAIVNSSFSLKRFYLTRLIQIPLASAVSLIIDYLFGLSRYICAYKPNHIYFSQSDSVIPLLCVIAMISIVTVTKIKQRTA